MPNLKLITLNVELNRHWEAIIPFLQREKPDVLCLQECIEHDVKMIAENLGYQYVHLPITKVPYSSEDPSLFAPQGIAILSKIPLGNVQTKYYYEAAPEIQNYKYNTLEDKRATVHQGIVWASIEKEGFPFTIATTHFTWTPDGKPSKSQDDDLVSLYKILDTIPSLIICGDFNIPRGELNHLYQSLTKRFTDNIPPHIQTTLDIQNHRVRFDPVEKEKLTKFVIDYIFSTPEYLVSDVRCEFGLSDHCAVIATISPSLYNYNK